MSTPSPALTSGSTPTTPTLVEPTKKRGPDGRVQEVSVPPFAPPVQRGSLAEIPFDNAREAPAEAVLSRKDADSTWHDVTAAEFAAEVLAVAKGLMAEGLRAGDRVAIMARTTYEWTLLDFAAWAAGLVTVPIYPTSSAFQARWILQDSGAVACAVETTEQGRLISQERKQLGDLAHLWQFDTGAIGHLKSLGKDIPDEAVSARRATLEPESPATLIYTSGTTGRP
ncbi:AMP-binding protein, partial [Streptomyces sp. SID2119]|uniref:AMP-binding protein n=2 Tax=Streptomyces TaxID=1883 RepID=UPI00136FAECB|nr:AMP-binding protein [Streptomyces sp. SID2119]